MSIVYKLNNGRTSAIKDEFINTRKEIYHD
jgi:hypothetical protein